MDSEKLIYLFILVMSRKLWEELNFSRKYWLIYWYYTILQHRVQLNISPSRERFRLEYGFIKCMYHYESITAKLVCGPLVVKIRFLIPAIKL